MRKDIINSLIPLISSLTMWAWNKMVSKKSSKKSSFNVVTGLAIISGVIISYFAANRFLKGFLK